MYYAMIILLMGVLPVASIVAEHAITNADWIGLAGRWVVFWASGLRLLIAGVRQVANPAFTARDIFEIETPGAEKIVIELSPTPQWDCSALPRSSGQTSYCPPQS